MQDPDSKRRSSSVIFSGSCNSFTPQQFVIASEGEVFTTETSASAGFNRLIYLWNVYYECEHFAVLEYRSNDGTAFQY